MNITFKNTDPVNATITIAVTKEDYQSHVQKALNDIRKNVVMDGFRKGNAPKSRIQSMYGQSAMIDEINKLVSGELYNYIKENQLNILGQPLPTQKQEQISLHFDKQEDYEFIFDLALVPKMDIRLTKIDKISYYTIIVSDEMIKKQIQNYKVSYGTYITVDTVESKDMVKGTLVEQNGSLHNNYAILMPSYIKDKVEQKKFIGAKVGNVLTFNPYKAFESSEAELTSFLKIKKEEVGEHQGDFTFSITEITRYKEAELGQELYDKIYEAGTVTTEDSLRERIRESLAQQLVQESDYKFILDAKAILEEKTKDIVFPDEFLKRWILSSNTKRTTESLETDYPKILQDLKFHLIKEQIVKENNITVDKEEVNKKAQNVACLQFAKYGISNIPDNILKNYVGEMMKKQETIRNLIDQIIESKLIALFKEQVTIESKEISIEEFNKLFEK